MRPSNKLRLASIAFALGGLCLWLAQGYFDITAPVLPYQPDGDDQYVVGVLDARRAGSIQAGDQIAVLDGRRIDGCQYLIESPIYSAPRNVPIPVLYERAGLSRPVATRITLTDPGPQDTLKRSPTIVLSFVFLVAGLIILLGGEGALSHLLLGLTWVSVGVMYASWDSYVVTPLSILAWWGIPVSVMLLVISHAIWPVDQWKRPLARIVVAGNALNSLFYVASFLPGWNWFGCYSSKAVAHFAHATESLTYLGFGVGFLGAVVLLIGAYRQTENPIARLQIRAITWAMAIGFGASVLFAFTESPWGPLGDLTQFLSGIAPLTYLFVLYRGQLLAIDRYLNRLVYVFLFLLFSFIVILALVRSILAWQPALDPYLLALCVVLPSLLAAGLMRERLGMLVDLVLYGAYYDYETVIPQLGKSLAGAVDEKRFAQVVTQQLPQALSIRKAALWLSGENGRMRLVEPPQEPLIPSGSVEQGVDRFPPGDAEVQVFDAPFQIDMDPGPWQAILRLRVDRQPVGLVLLGLKLRENTYSQRDVRTLQTLASWIATSAANLAHLQAQAQAAEREHRLMRALAENEERLTTGVVRELHDRGISALGMVRLMVEQERGRAIVSAGLEQVITNLRELSDSQLSPTGLNRGLPQALEAMVETQQQLGLPVVLEVQPGFAESEPPSALVSRELFYIAQEATVNALKHASPTRVAIALGRLDGRVRLQVHNDGLPFDVAPKLSGREAHGMGIMQARASRIGGLLTITSSQETGTDVIVTIDPMTS